MMNELFWIIGATFAISLISFIGVVTLAIRGKNLDKILLLLVSFSAGALMGNAFLELMPEALEFSSGVYPFIYLLAGFILFFVVEKAFHWRHCHKKNCPEHTFAYMNLIGDSVHNFIDGLILAATFVTDINLGVATTIAVSIHEIPQEIGDFGVLIYGKFTAARAVMLNFITALTAVLGGIIGYVITSYAHSISGMLIPIAAGGFVYIAASDLIPEIRKENDVIKSALNIMIFIIGIALMYTLGMLFME